MLFRRRALGKQCGAEQRLGRAFELAPDRRWVNSTGYLRAMMQGFIEHLYPYTGDARTLTFLQSFVDYELENGLTPGGLCLVAGAVRIRESGRQTIHRLEPAGTSPVRFLSWSDGTL